MNKAVMIIALLLAGCATGTRESAPDWLDGRSAQYPEARYLLGQGQAPSAAQARDRARTELAKVFATRVSEHSEDVARAELSSEDGVARQRSESTAERRVQTETQRVLEGVRIAEVWRDEAGDYHALAVLDRVSEGQRLRNEIAALDRAIARAITRARSEEPLLVRIGAAAQAVSAQTQRDTLQQDLRVLDVSGIGVPAQHERARLQADFAELAGRLRIAAQTEADPFGNLVSVVQGAVRHAGFVNAPAEQADYRLVANLALETSTADGWQWANGTLELRMLDGAGSAVGSARFALKASARDAALARQRLLAEVDRLLRARLRDTVLGFADGGV
jgi:hypothetical protein